MTVDNVEGRTLKVLLIDDDEDDFVMARDLLADIGGRKFTLDWAADYTQALDEAGRNAHDVCLVDYRLGEHTGLDLLTAARENGCRAPFILLTGQDSKEIDLDAMKAGAADFLVKGEITGALLARSIRYAIERKRVEDELAAALARLAQLAQYDYLTGLPNRALFRERLDRALARARRNDTAAALLFMDLDRFKTVNDTLGHNYGDQLLKETAQRLQGCLRKVDTVARWGGDEFTVILESLPQRSGASIVAQKLIDALAAPFQLDEHELFVTTSIGIAIYPSCGEDPETLTNHADAAMYRAKEQGRNTYQFYIEEMNAR